MKLLLLFPNCKIYLDCTGTDDDTVSNSLQCGRGVYYTVTELHAVLAMPCILTVSFPEHVEEVDRGELANLSSPWNTDC